MRKMGNAPSYGAFPHATYAETVEPADVSPAEPVDYQGIFNQGQDCAAPNSILVHSAVYEEFIQRLIDSIRNVRIGLYEDPEVQIGPISRPDSMPRILELMAQYRTRFHSSTPGTVNRAANIIYPTVVEQPLEIGGVFDESFAPIFFVQKYKSDDELGKYFDDPKYTPHAMYISLFGESPYIEKLIGNADDGEALHSDQSIIRNTDLLAPGVERGTKAYGGYGAGASYVSIHNNVKPQPILVPREIHRYIVSHD